MPIRRFEISSPLAIEEVAERLAQAVRPSPDRGQRVLELLRNAPEPTPFLGVVTSDGFLARPDAREQGPFPLVVRGAISPAPSGTLIRVMVRMHLGVMLTVVVFCAYALFATLVAPAVAGRSSGLPGTIFLAASVLILAAGLKVWFYPEAKRIRQALEAILGAAPMAWDQR
jgi:drug/metabolite transporter superfamily protein YnfA